MTLPVPTLQAEVTYPTTGSAGPFSVPFPYLDKAHVKVYVDEVATLAYTWPTASTILFNVVPTGAYILFRRETPMATPLVSIASGSISPSDINTLATQACYMAQEVNDKLTHVPMILGDPLAPLGTADSEARGSRFWAFDALGVSLLISLAGLQAAAAATSLEQYLSKSGSPITAATLAAADAAAVVSGGTLIIDGNVSLTGNTTLNAQRVRMAGGIITRGAFNLTFNGVVDCPDMVAFTERAGAGNVTFANCYSSLAWFSAKQDTTPLGATVTDNQNAWVKCCLAGSNGIVKIPCLNPLKSYSITTGASVTGPTEIRQDDQAYFQIQGAGYVLTYNGGGGAGKIHVALRAYGAATSLGLIKYVGNTGYIEDELWAYNFPAGEMVAYYGLTFNYMHKNSFARNCFRVFKSYAAYGEVTNAVRFHGGLWHNDSTTPADPNGWVLQLQRGNGWEMTGKPDIQQMHATPVPLFMLSSVTPVDASDGQVLNVVLGDAYYEGNYTNVLSVGRNAAGTAIVYPSSLQKPRDIHCTILQSSNSATLRMVDYSQVQGGSAKFGYTLGGQLFRDDAGCDCIKVEVGQETGLYTFNTSATNVMLWSTKSISYDNNVTSALFAGGMQLLTGNTISGGNGAPTGTGPLGSLYMRRNGGASTTLYINETGTTTWRAI